MYEVTELLARSRHLLGKGVSKAPIADWQQILAEKKFLCQIEVPKNTVNNIKINGVNYIEGTAAFIDQSIVVNDLHLTADYYVVAVGAKTMNLPFEGKMVEVLSERTLSGYTRLIYSSK